MKRNLLSFTALIAMGVALTSCSDAYYEWAEQFNNLKSDYVEHLDVDLNKKIDLKVLYPNSGMDNSTFKNSRTTQYYEELTGYKVDYYQELGDQTTAVSNILTTQQKYDMLKLESGTFTAFVGNNSFVDLKPFLEKYGQNLLEVIPQEAWDAVTSADGKIYSIPEAGFGGMLGFALVWNVEQLEEVGITKIPETIGEVDDAFHALQKHFGAIDRLYNAFAMQGSQAYISTLAAAYELEEDFFIDENDKVSHVMNHPSFDAYSSWLTGLATDVVKNDQGADCGYVIPREWQGYNGSDIVSEFASGLLGCGYIPYWNVNTLVSKLMANNNISETEARDMLGWSVYIKGDGSHGSTVQEEAKFVAYNKIGYHICVPSHMAASTAYVVDWIDQRITESAFEGYRLGDEGVHFNYSDSSNLDAIKVTISGQEKYVVLTDKYEIDILPTSMYQTGVNPTVGRNLWILSEQSYDAWSVMVDFNSPNAIGNALGLCPYIEGWSKIDIESRSWVLTIQQNLYKASTDTLYAKTLDGLKRGWVTKYWTEEVDANVQEWYQSTKNNKK